MRYSDFESIISPARMNRYLLACNSSTKKAMTLYRFNLRLSQELFTVISCFEVSLRNAIDNYCLAKFGPDWLRTSATDEAIFNNAKCKLAANNIKEEINKLNNLYTHNKLVAELRFGFWRYMFAPNQFRATGNSLLQIFPAKPTSSLILQYNHKFVFNQLAQINVLRNRIAHHEPICFTSRQPVKSTNYVRQNYGLLKQLFQWMEIDESSLLYGLDHITKICNQIDDL